MASFPDSAHTANLPPYTVEAEPPSADCYRPQSNTGPECMVSIIWHPNKNVDRLLFVLILF